MKSAEEWRMEMDFKTVEGLHKSIRRIQADALRWAFKQVYEHYTRIDSAEAIRSKANELETKGKK